MGGYNPNVEEVLKGLQMLAETLYTEYFIDAEILEDAMGLIRVLDGERKHN